MCLSAVVGACTNATETTALHMVEGKTEVADDLLASNLDPGHAAPHKTVLETSHEPANYMVQAG